MGGIATNAWAVESEIIALARALDLDPSQRNALGWEWIRMQGPRFAHWEPAWLTDPDLTLCWVWGVRFVRWVKNRYYPPVSNT
jgi:hypothetical protein